MVKWSAHSHWRTCCRFIEAWVRIVLFWPITKTYRCDFYLNDNICANVVRWYFICRMQIKSYNLAEILLERSTFSLVSIIRTGWSITLDCPSLLIRSSRPCYNTWDIEPFLRRKSTSGIRVVCHMSRKWHTPYCSVNCGHISPYPLLRLKMAGEVLSQ